MSTEGILAIVIPVLIAAMGAVFFHFREMRAMEKQLTELRFEQEKLRHKDEMQQMVIDNIREQLPTLVELAKQHFIQKKTQEGEK